MQTSNKEINGQSNIMDDKTIIKKRMKEIEQAYKNTFFPKRYLSDVEYIKLKHKLRDITNPIEEKVIEEKKEQKINLINSDLYKKDKQEFFDELPSEAKKVLIDANYDIFLDKDNILSFYPKPETFLSEKVMKIRLKHIKSFKRQKLLIIGLLMTERQKRSIERKKKMTVKRLNLHDLKHNSFHFELNTTESWNLLYTISIKKWEEETGQIAPLRVDKNKVRFINLKDKD